MATTFNPLTGQSVTTPDPVIAGQPNASQARRILGTAPTKKPNPNTYRVSGLSGVEQALRTVAPVSTTTATSNTAGRIAGASGVENALGITGTGADTTTVIKKDDTEKDDTTTTTTTTDPIAKSTDALTLALDKILADTLASYGLTGMANTIAQIRNLYPEATSADVSLMLKNDSRFNGAYNTRFAGNAMLKAKGLPTMDDATYLKTEREYYKIFNSYGAGTLANQATYAKLISNGMDAVDVTDRLSLAYDHIKANPKAAMALQQFYPMLSTGDIVATMLDPENQLPALKKKVQSAEIGGEALKQGLSTNLSDITTASNKYSNVTGGTIGVNAIVGGGNTVATSSEGYQKIAGQLPTLEKLSAISGKTLAQYGQKEAEQNILLGSAAAQEKYDAQVKAEQARLQGSAGTAKGAFATQYLTRQSGAGQY